MTFFALQYNNEHSITLTYGDAIASWLVRSTPDRRSGPVRSLTEYTVLCSCDILSPQDIK